MLSRIFVSGPKLFTIISRGLRKDHRIIRTKLPKYQINVSQVPPLTNLLTNGNAENYLELRREKLEVYKKYIPARCNKNLLEALFDEKSDIDNLLNVISENLETMTSFYLGVSFEALDDMMRAKLCQPDTVAVSPEFRQLCTKTLYKIRFFEPDEILKLLKCASTLRLPEDILLVQAALQMAKNQINDYNLDELRTLSESLNSIKAVDAQGKSLLVAMKKTILMLA